MRTHASLTVYDVRVARPRVTRMRSTGTSGPAAVAAAVAGWPLNVTEKRCPSPHAGFGFFANRRSTEKPAGTEQRISASRAAIAPSMPASAACSAARAAAVGATTVIEAVVYGSARCPPATGAASCSTRSMIASRISTGLASASSGGSNQTRTCATARRTEAST
jgi:hypothetical protein